VYGGKTLCTNISRLRLTENSDKKKINLPKFLSKEGGGRVPRKSNDRPPTEKEKRKEDNWPDKLGKYGYNFWGHKFCRGGKRGKGGEGNTLLPHGHEPDQIP